MESSTLSVNAALYSQLPVVRYEDSLLPPRGQCVITVWKDAADSYAKSSQGAYIRARYLLLIVHRGPAELSAGSSFRDARQRQIDGMHKEACMRVGYAQLSSGC